MCIERWGAFSVIDYKDARKLAAEVLLYDRLLVPTPMVWDRNRWVENGWEPDRLDQRLEQLREIAIQAAWDQDEQKDWKSRFDALGEDLQDINSALQVTRRVLTDHARRYLPEGVNAIEAFSAYQSEADFQKAQLTDPNPRGKLMSEFDFLVAQRIIIPDEADPEESLKRALDLTNNSTFRERRSRFYQWQHEVLTRGIPPKDAANDLPRLVEEYNDIVRKSTRSYRIETAILVGSLSATALAAAAGVVPPLFAGIGIGVLTGAKVASVGTSATGAVLQIAKHLRGRREPDSATKSNLSGAMFHQIEEETGWNLRIDKKVA